MKHAPLIRLMLAILMPVLPLKIFADPEPSSVPKTTVFSSTGEPAVPGTPPASVPDARVQWEREVQGWKGAVEVDGEVQENLISFGHNHIIRGKVQGDVIKFGGSVAILGEVKGSVTVLGGNVIVLGPVHGDVTAIGGNISVDALVTGNVLSLGATCTGSQADIRGEVSQTRADFNFKWDSQSMFSNEQIASALGRGLVGISDFFLSTLSLLWGVSLLIWNVCLSLLVVTLFPGAVNRAANTLRQFPVRCGFVGMVWSAVFWVLLLGALLLCLLLVGLPIVFCLVVFDFLLGAFGSAVAGTRVGRFVLQRSGHADPSEHLAVFSGCCVLGVIRLIPYAGTVVWWIAGWMGVGAAILSRLEGYAGTPSSLPPPVPGAPIREV
jgi:hypothetical protein